MLLGNGLLRGSFIPPRYIRQLRDLLRHRSKLNHTIAAEKNRVEKYLEDANVKLSGVATDIFGVSGREILKEIIRGNTSQGNKWLKSILVRCALSAARTNGAYLQDKYHRLASRRGKKKAALAIGHKILVGAYHMLKHKIHYKELGIDYLDKRNKGRIQRHYINKLIQLGYEVSLVEKQVA